jgi:hypothetical protein
VEQGSPALFCLRLTPRCHMKLRSVALAAGVSCLLLGVGVRAVPQAGVAGETRQPKFLNARVDTQAAGAGLSRAMAGILRERTSATWIGYSVPATPGEHDMCDSNRRPGRLYLEGRPAPSAEDEARSASAESADLVVLLRVEPGKAQKLRVASFDCEIDAGGLPVVWLSGVTGADSVTFLQAIVNGEAAGIDVKDEPAMMAIALHRDPAAERALEAFAAPGEPSSLRKRAAFWLASSRGAEGFQALRRLVAGERDARVRRDFVFPLSVSRRPESVDVLIRLVREDESPEVRKQAMFWLARSKDARALAFMEEILKK